ncbi:hypothetical protein IFM89_003124 [Coptis chinensis]|uniref:Integrator complex subunit 7 n=1 Tax=Coptis chinensis TaxID=261450 RepID=A0A835IUQ0_9MAGN|nr:hypothetical protein IFM89_003124 [Coptis chinensis]
MERNSAACAMEWSIELEKGLRSNKPGRRIEAITQIGQRLEQWSKEPSSTMVISNIYGLVPGEDRLFANAVLLRLADAFKYGDKHTRLCILKTFLLERSQRKKGKKYVGLLAKERIANYQQLLKRVKIVFDRGDVESRAITLCFLGCWSDFAKDSAEIRHMVLSSLGSCHVLEVKASIFTAGCFSELSGDFACIFLEVLINMVSSSKTSITVKLACAKAFAKLGISFTLASRGYKTGRKLLLNSSEEEFIVEMLMSLSKLATKSLLLISEQVELLLSFITHNSVLRVQVMAIRCMLFLLEGGVCRFPVDVGLLARLFNVLDGNVLPTAAQCDALRILLKIFRSTQPSVYCIEMSEFVKWVSIVESATQSRSTSKRLLARQLLVDISLKCKGGVETNALTDLPSRVLLLVLDQLAQLVKPVSKPCKTASELAQECQSLLSFSLFVVEEYPSLGVLALTKISSCIESLVNMGKGGFGENPASSSREVVLLDGKKDRSITSQLVLCMYQFVECCIEILNEASSITAEVHQIVKLLSKVLHKSYLVSDDMCTIQLILLHSRVVWSYFTNVDKKICNVDNLGISDNDYWIESEMITREFVRKMMARPDKWAAYKAGKCAACHGSWFAAAFIFRQLINNVQSDACQNWLKSLSLFAKSGSTVMLLFLPGQDQRSVNKSHIHEIWTTPCGLLGKNTDGASCNAILWDYCGSSNEAYGDVCSAVELLEAAVTTDHTFFFQRWFLNLRAKVLEILVVILRLLDPNPCKEEDIHNSKLIEGCTGVGLSRPALDANSFTVISLRLKKLAQELDLLATSFMDMDPKSVRIIFRLALNCSLLAFCTGFCVEDSKKCSHSMLLQDLAKRLCHVDSEMSATLTQLLTLVGEPNSCFHPPPRVPVYKAGQEERILFDICKFALSKFLCMLEEAKETKAQGVSYQEPTARLQLLSSVLERWMNMSFQIPKYFFELRSCIGAELFVFNADTKSPSKLLVFPGFHLSLNICLQLKHVPPSRVTKLYCILASKPSYWTPGHDGESKGKMLSEFKPWDSNDTVDLNEKLWMYVTEGAKRSGKKLARASSGDPLVWSCVSFVLNGRGQGFSSCLLDVSAFPVGSYEIKWHICCIDSKDSYWNLVPLNMGPVFSVNRDTVAG